MSVVDTVAKTVRVKDTVIRAEDLQLLAIEARKTSNNSYYVVVTVYRDVWRYRLVGIGKDGQTIALSDSDVEEPLEALQQLASQLGVPAAPWTPQKMLQVHRGSPVRVEYVDWTLPHGSAWKIIKFLLLFFLLMCILGVCGQTPDVIMGHFLPKYGD